MLASRLGARDGLSAERSYVTSTLPRGVARGMLDAVLGGDPAGAARAAAIIGGLACTTTGYLVGSLRARLGRRPSSAWSLA
jgi:hypothetical protein